MTKKKSAMGNIVSTGIGNIVGVGMIGATAGMVNQLPAGTAKDIAGVVPGLQSAALVGQNLKMFNGNGKRRHSPKHHSKHKTKLW
jgi:hypothetical protein